MSQIIENAIGKLSLNGDMFKSKILLEDVKSSCTKLSDEEWRVLRYFTIIGTGDIYRYYDKSGYEEVKNLLDFFDRVLKKLGCVVGGVVYRMDSYDSHVEKWEYMQVYRNYMDHGVCLQIPWSLSVSMENWNKISAEYPIWEIELLPSNSKAHPIYLFLSGDKTLQDLEMEVRFESNTLFKIVEVTEQDGFPYIKMKEVGVCQCQTIKLL